MLTTEQAEEAHIGLNPAPTVESVEDELRASKLGMALEAVLALALEIDQLCAKRASEARAKGWKPYWRTTPEERMAELLLNKLGSPDDCWFLRDVAERCAP
jgi:hypothetical protein